MDDINDEPAPLDNLEGLGSLGGSSFQDSMLESYLVYRPDHEIEETVPVVPMEGAMDASNSDPLSMLETLENTAVSGLGDSISGSIDFDNDSRVSTVHAGLPTTGTQDSNKGSEPDLDLLVEKRIRDNPHQGDSLNTMDPYAEIPEPHMEPPAVVGRPPSFRSSIASGGCPVFEQDLDAESTDTPKPVPNYMAVRRRQPKPSADTVIMKKTELVASGNTNQSNQGFDALGYIEDGYTTISKYRTEKEDDQTPPGATQPAVIPGSEVKPESTVNTARYSACMSPFDINTSRQKVLQDDKIRFGTLDPRKLEDVTPSKMVNGRFVNPWETWRDPKLANVIRWACMRKQGTIPSKSVLDELLPVLTPDPHKIHAAPPSGVNITWIGHASVMVQMDGITILTDPIFSDYCGPASLVGYYRFRPPPCTVNQLPKIHAVVISHSHYDHLDLPTVVALNNRFGSHLRWFVPLGLADWFTQTGVENVIELDWWQENCIPDHSDVTFAFTPSQHWSQRTAFDKHKSLWGSWSIIGPNHSFFFAGDTGYCKGFKEIGQRYGPFDVAAIPIGAYIPRWFLSPQHVDPTEAVQIHLDIQAKQSLGIHWGTFELGKEHYLAPKEDLKIALDKAELTDEDFFTLKHGETRLLSAEEDPSTS
ncbi:N-acyl-phosphatidylethanolamine-hydrolyzing phospholipase D-like [Asterias rubens]|uniref:N-acyl-phosphatidylethanolamine-hydrolyzing phospholipase D-like n=1 Tax=Asterias rubens TaxID=7604 RepID=UPI0014553C19|nr:N-acyl-phosphatidylethanolamine-hydrolyzing phospholipase D-like [Asterias rubens]XP_033645642.1 N-acyl-phosphatidylethanolamine-hydrolyzing phospholipase D-like [Asterias rubens]XP_033645651.1 N-acyl-phosphatidylethanolamine-hydrolyzing phospholipase D-like [Asterias rubens]